MTPPHPEPLPHGDGDHPDDADAAPHALLVLNPHDTAWRRAVIDAVRRAGFDLGDGPVSRAMEAIQRVVDTAPSLIVLELAQAGVFGVRLVPMLRSVAPGAVIHVLAPLDTLTQAATASGADGAFLDVDLRGFSRAAQALAQERARARA